METANNNQPFNQQFTQIDVSTFQDEWGEIHTSPIIIMPSAEESVPFVAKGLSQIVERIIRARMGKNWTTPTLSTTEYFDRIRAYRPVHCKDGHPEGCYISIAEHASENRLYGDTGLACMPDVDKLGRAYHSTLIELADELIEYRTLKAARPLLNRD